MRALFSRGAEMFAALLAAICVGDAPGDRTEVHRLDRAPSPVTTLAHGGWGASGKWLGEPARAGTRQKRRRKLARRTQGARS